MMMTCLKREFRVVGSLLGLGLLCLPCMASAATLYNQDFESFATGTASPDGWWSFEGPAEFSNPIEEVQSYLGSQALVYQADGSGTFGTSWYWYAGIGRSDIATSLGAPAAAATLSMDLAVIGAETTTLLEIRVSQWDPTANMGMGADSWEAKWTPTLSTDGSFTTWSATLDTGTQTGVYDSSRSLSINAITFNNNGFGYDDGNLIIIDNVQLSVVPEPSGVLLVVSSVVTFGAFRRWWNL